MAPKKDIPVQACCNPFNDHTKRNKGLRPISRVFTDRYPSAGLRVGNKLCGMCRKRIIAQSTRNSPEAQDVAGPSTAVEDVEFEDDPVSTFNETLSPLGISPFKKQRLQRSKHYAKGKVKRVGTAIKRKLETMDNLQIGEFLVLLDFAENYAFVLQDAAQGFLWNNAQATIHPFVCYYRSDDTLKHISYVVISDCMKHDTVSVHLFQRNLVRFLKDRFDATPSKMIYFSDGAASQYKNRKNFSNLCHRVEDFEVRIFSFRTAILLSNKIL